MGMRDNHKHDKYMDSIGQRTLIIDFEEVKLTSRRFWRRRLTSARGLEPGQALCPSCRCSWWMTLMGGSALSAGCKHCRDLGLAVIVILSCVFSFTMAVQSASYCARFVVRSAPACKILYCAVLFFSKPNQTKSREVFPFFPLRVH